MNLVLEKKIPRINDLKKVISSNLHLFNLNDNILLQGSLGIGKTCFTKIFLTALGCDDLITSPTFTLINEYHLNHQSKNHIVRHIDLYRLGDLKKTNLDHSILTELPILDFFESEDLVLVEWGDLFPEFFSYYTIKIEIGFFNSNSHMKLTTKNNEKKIRKVRIFKFFFWLMNINAVIINLLYF